MKFEFLHFWKSTIVTDEWEVLSRSALSRFGYECERREKVEKGSRPLGVARSGPHRLARIARARGTRWRCRSSGSALGSPPPASQNNAPKADGEARPWPGASRGPVAFKGRQLRRPERRAASCWARPRRSRASHIAGKRKQHGTRGDWQASARPPCSATAQEHPPRWGSGDSHPAKAL